MFCENCGKEIGDKAAVCPGCGRAVKEKKTIYKKWWFWAIIAVLCVVIAQGQQAADSSPTDGAASTNSPIAGTSASATTSNTAAAIITLVAGERGEYGELITLNAGSEFEETYYIYRLPAGTYTVTNAGQYMDQFSVYGDTVYTTVEGWEEFSDVYYVKLFDVGSSETVHIPDNCIVEIHEPGQWELKRISD